MRIRPVLRCCVLAGLLASPFPSSAVGLGRLTLQSGLGQALQAEIELTSVQPGELDTLSARLADQATYARNRIDYAGTLSRVRLTLDSRGGRPILRLSSTQPVNDPFLDLLIEINWASGRIVREYTFLLDPPGYAATAPVDPAPAIPSEALAPPVTAAAAPARAAAPVAGAPAASAAPGPRPNPSSGASGASAGSASKVAAPSGTPSGTPSGAQSAAGQYGPVRRGETLAAIAAKVKPQGVTLEQMLSALYRSNAQAFEGKNMNRLRTGPMLTVPNPDEVAVPHDEARKEIRVQAADWRAYRERLASSIGSSESPATPARAPSGGRITTAIDEKSAPAPGSDRLQLSKGEPVTGTISGRGSAAARAENAVASDRAVTEANARVVELERQLKNMQRLLELKQPAMAGQQLAAADAKGATKALATPATAATPMPAPAATPSSAVQTVAPMAATPSTPANADAAKTAAPKTDAVKADAKSDMAKSDAAKADAARIDGVKVDAAKADAARADAAKSDASKSDTKSDATRTDASNSDASKTPALAALDAQKTAPAGTGASSPAKTDAAVTATKAATPDATKTKAPLQAPAPQPETSMLDELMGNSLLLIGLGSALLLALVWAVLARRRRNATTKFEDSIGASTDLRTSTVFGNTGGGVVNTGDNSLVSDFSREGMGNIDTGEVDPIAEAEVYLAYGRDNQAEEILRDALTKTPDRQEIRLKLLEIYAQQNKAAAFEGMASELFNATDGKGEMWNKAAQLGRTIDADNPLYAARDSEPAAVGAASMMNTLTSSPSSPSSSRLDRMSDSNMRVAEAVEKSAAETGFGFTDHARKEVFVMPPALTPAEAARAAAGSASNHSLDMPGSHAASPRDSFALGAATLAAPIGAAAAASVAAASAARGSAVRDRAPLDFKLDSGPEESADAPPATMDFVTLDGPITLTGSSTLTGPSSLSGVTLASPASDMWGEKPQSTLSERVDSGAARAERSFDLPERDFAHEFTSASAPDTLSPMTRSGVTTSSTTSAATSSTTGATAHSDFSLPANSAASASTTAPSSAASYLDLDKLDLEFEPDMKAAADDGSSSALDGQWHDAATKLDLAKAYHEMGDVDGAREILQEVTQEGDDEQKKEAQAFLSKLRP